MDVGSYGGYGNTRACSRRDEREIEGLHYNTANVMFFTPGWGRKNRMTVGREESSEDWARTDCEEEERERSG